MNVWLARYFFLGVFAGPLVGSVVHSATPEYMGTIHFVIHEPTAQLVARAHDLFRAQFEATRQNWPIASGERVEYRVEGPRINVSFRTPSEVETAVQSEVTALVRSLNGRVYGGGHFYLYRMSDPVGQLEVRLAPGEPNRVSYLVARSVPLIEVLKELRRKMPSFSYAVSHDCGQQTVNLDFGSSQQPQAIPAQPIQAVMGAVSLALQGNHREVQRGNTYLFSDCDSEAVPVRLLRTQFAPPPSAPAELLPALYVLPPSYE